MLPDRVSNPGPLTYVSGALPIALRGPAFHASNPLVLSKGFLLQNSVQAMNPIYKVHVPKR